MISDVPDRTIGRRFAKAWIIGKPLRTFHKGVFHHIPNVFVTIEEVPVKLTCDLCEKEHRTFKDRDRCEKQRIKVEELRQ